MGQAERYGIFKVMTSCPHCGNPVIVNGPMTEPACGSCQQKVAVDDDLWKELVGSYLEEYDELEPGEGKEGSIDTGSMELKFTYVRLPPPTPACPDCETEWDLDEVQTGFDGEVTCKQCGRTTSSFPAPGWFKGLFPAATQIFFGEREAGGATGDAPGMDGSGAIALSCPKCGASLPIGPDTDRTTTCKYCEADVYLPDGVWLRLRPAKVAKFWLVRFEDA